MILYLLANDVTDYTKRAILPNVCGAKMRNTIHDLVTPAKPMDISYDDIITQVQQYYNPKPLVTVQRFKFNSQSRQP